MGWFEDLVSMDGRLKGKDRRDRQLLFICAVCGLLVAVCGVSMVPGPQLTFFLIACYVLVFGTMSSIIAMCLCRVSITRRAVKAYVIMWTVSICLIQLHDHTLSPNPVWSLFVMVLDLSLVLRLGRPFATRLLIVIALWIVLNHVEASVRFGLFDLPGTVPTWYRLEHSQEMCDCVNPPCRRGVGSAMVRALEVLMILVIDFIATRGFAEEAEKEQAAMARTIETVEAAAQLLAGYDVDNVAELLEAAEGRLPPAMHAALQRLEENLRLYRPYLPAALFERVPIDDVGGRSIAPVAAPGSESGEATLVFTDIRASTSVWEAAPEAMQKAIRTHNAVMREAVSRFCGYEVKTIGDAFMVAFEEPCAGVCFGLAVQEALLAAEWPAALLEVPICRRTGLWGGLTVRVGVNHGPVMAETNALTGRVDYFGHTVNVASRLESTCVPGAVAVPSAVWSQVSGACAPAVAGGKVVAELKGVSEALPVRHVWPAALADRQHKPLAELPPDVLSLSSLGSISSFSSRLYRSVNRAATVTQGHATVGVLSLTTVMDSSAHHQISDCLELIVPLLQQSRGTLVSLLGERLFTGWNLVQPVRVHAENAVQFVRRVLRVPLCESLTVGLASGTVYHGDVGTRSQRFVTAAGPGVAAGLQVWRTACDAGRRFLYSPGEGTVLVGALQAVLQPTTLVLQKPASWGTLPALYELLDEARGNERHDKVSKVQLD